MTDPNSVARFLALAIQNLGGHLKVSKQLLDEMLPVRLVWDATSEPDYVTLAIISNDVITLTVEKSSEETETDRNPEPMLEDTLQ